MHFYKSSFNPRGYEINEQQRTLETCFFNAHPKYFVADIWLLLRERKHTISFKTLTQQVIFTIQFLFQNDKRLRGYSKNYRPEERLDLTLFRHNVKAYFRVEVHFKLSKSTGFLNQFFKIRIFFISYLGPPFYSIRTEIRAKNQQNIWKIPYCVQNVKDYIS